MENISSWEIMMYCWKSTNIFIVARVDLVSVFSMFQYKYGNGCLFHWNMYIIFLRIKTNTNFMLINKF